MLLLALFGSFAVADEVLPVHRIRFYETGVGWFEREGTVTSTTSLPVPTSHLDDALKTLVVLGGDVDLGAITFPTAVAGDAARTQAGLGTADRLSYGSALRSMLGTRVELTLADRTVRGVLFDVQGPLPRTAAAADATPRILTDEFALGVLTDEGGVERVTTEQVRRLRAGQSEVADRLVTASQTLSAGRAQRPTPLSVSLRRGGRLGLGYLAETPVWRVSYRLVEPDAQSEGRADLVAWALVHNDTDEDWQGITVEVANGEPDSFLYPLAGPRYAQRELRAPDRNLETLAQLGNLTVDEMIGGLSGSGYGMGGLGSRGSGAGGGGASFGVRGAGVMAVAALKAAATVQTPTQFVYRVARPVDLPARHSALVPLVQQPVDAEAVVVFDGAGGSGRSALWLQNSTQRTLPAGVVTVVQQGGLAGESQLERLKPGEEQMLAFANELDVELTRQASVSVSETERVIYRDRYLEITESTPTVHDVTVENRSQVGKRVWMSLSLGPTEDVAGEWRTEVDRHSGVTYVALRGPAGESRHQVRTERRSTVRTAPEAIDAETYRAWAAAGLGDADRLTQAADAREELAGLQARSQALEAEIGRAGAQLQGLRTSLKATEGDGGGPLARRAAAVEQEVRKLTARRAVLIDRRARTLEALHVALTDDADGRTAER